MLLFTYIQCTEYYRSSPEIRRGNPCLVQRFSAAL